VDVPDQRQILCLDIHQRCDRLAGDNQQMHRRFGRDVVNDDYLFGLMPKSFLCFRELIVP
jgi:hypothetical protein